MCWWCCTMLAKRCCRSAGARKQHGTFYCVSTHSSRALQVDQHVCQSAAAVQLRPRPVGKCMEATALHQQQNRLTQPVGSCWWLCICSAVAPVPLACALYRRSAQVSQTIQQGGHDGLVPTWVTVVPVLCCVSCSCGPMMLDVLLKIKDEQDQSLTLRRSCRCAGEGLGRGSVGARARGVCVCDGVFSKVGVISSSSSSASTDTGCARQTRPEPYAQEVMQLYWAACERQRGGGSGGCGSSSSSGCCTNMGCVRHTFDHRLALWRSCRCAGQHARAL